MPSFTQTYNQVRAASWDPTAPRPAPAPRPASLDLAVAPHPSGRTTHKRKAEQTTPAASPEGGPIHAQPQRKWSREPPTGGPCTALHLPDRTMHAAPSLAHLAAMTHAPAAAAAATPAATLLSAAAPFGGFVHGGAPPAVPGALRLPRGPSEDPAAEDAPPGPAFCSFSKLLDYKSAESILCLTKEMAREMLPGPPPGASSFQTTIVLVDPNGAEWNVTYRCVPNRYSYEFRSGWKQFAAHWKITTGDTVVLQRVGGVKRDRILISITRHAVAGGAAGGEAGGRRLPGLLEQELLRAVELMAPVT